MTLILCGHQGVGKTRLGKYLAKQRRQSFIDTDDLLKNTLGCPLNSRLSEAHRRMGDNAFREIERDTILSLSPRDSCVISIGGGAFYHEESVSHLQSLGAIIWLQKNNMKTHLLSQNPVVYWVQAMQDNNTLDAWLIEREKNYRHHANYIACIDGLSLASATQRCLRYGEQYGQ